MNREIQLTWNHGIPEIADNGLRLPGITSQHSDFIDHFTIFFSALLRFVVLLATFKQEPWKFWILAGVDDVGCPLSP